MAGDFESELNERKQHGLPSYFFVRTCTVSNLPMFFFTTFVYEKGTLFVFSDVYVCCKRPSLLVTKKKKKKLSDVIPLNPPKAHNVRKNGWTSFPSFSVLRLSLSPFFVASGFSLRARINWKVKRSDLQTIFNPRVLVSRGFLARLGKTRSDEKRRDFGAPLAKPPRWIGTFSYCSVTLRKTKQSSFGASPNVRH